MVFYIVKFTQQTIDVTWSIAAAVECTNAKGTLGERQTATGSHTTGYITKISIIPSGTHQSVYSPGVRTNQECVQIRSVY